MTTEVIATGPDVAVPTVARIMHDHGISGLPVLDTSGKLVGIVTEMDIVSHEIQVDSPAFVPLLGAVIRMPWDTSDDDLRRVLATTARELMTSPVYSVTTDATIREVANLMFERKVNPVPVLDRENRVVGIVSRSDIVRLVAEAESALSSS
jgi:CBS domain-containing protein